MDRAAGAKDRHLRHAKRSGDVHQAGVVAYYIFCSRYRNEREGQRGFSRQVQAFSGLLGVDGRCDFFTFGGFFR